MFFSAPRGPCSRSRAHSWRCLPLRARTRRAFHLRAPLVLSAPCRIRTCEAEASDLQSASFVRLDNDASATVQGCRPSRNVPEAVCGSTCPRAARSRSGEVLTAWGRTRALADADGTLHLISAGISVSSESCPLPPGVVLGALWGWHPSLVRMTVPLVAKGSLCSCHRLAPGSKFQVLDYPLRAL